MPSAKSTASASTSVKPAGSSLLHSSNAAKVAAFRARQRAFGLTELTLWVPAQLVDIMRAMARAAADMHIKGSRK